MMFCRICFRLAFVATSLFAAEDQWFVRDDEPPKSKAPRGTISAAETVLLGGGPVVPLRQSERKKPPKPDILAAKVIWGESATFTSANGQKMPIADWNLVDNDLGKMVESGQKVGIAGHWTNMNLDEFNYDPGAMPSLLFSGVRTFKLPPNERGKLREYVLKGGTIILDSIYGSPYFYESAKKVMESVFPEERFRALPSDHPLYHMFHDIDTVSYPEDPASTKPKLETIYIGSRAAILLSEQGLGTGWDGNQRVFGKLKQRGLKPKYYSIDSAKQIAMNLSGYITGYLDVGMIEGTPELFGLPDEKRPTDEFVFAQLKHDGAWNVHPGAAPSLLIEVRNATAIRVNLKRVAVDPGKDDLAPFPFLYLTGLDDFTFSDTAIAELQRFFKNGGKLLINNGLGLSTFDAACRRELGRILPDRQLAAIPVDHDVYNTLQPLSDVRYTPALMKAKPELRGKAYLEGIATDGTLQVIYSPFDLEAGWLNVDYPLSRGYQAASARALGMNVIAYVISN
jgi:hypothetical protein